MDLYVAPEPLVAGWLADTLGWAADRLWFDADPPDDLGTRLPLVHIAGFGGGGDGLVTTRPNVDIDVYAGTIEAARAVTADLYNALMQRLPNTHLGGEAGVTVNQVAVFAYPSPQSYDQNDDIRRMSMSFTLILQASTA